MFLLLLFTATKFEVFLRVFQGKSFRAQSALKPECNGENNIAYCDIIAKQCHRVCDLEWDFRKLLSQFRRDCDIVTAQLFSV